MAKYRLVGLYLQAQHNIFWSMILGFPPMATWIIGLSQAYLLKSLNSSKSHTTTFVFSLFLFFQTQIDFNLTFDACIDLRYTSSTPTKSPDFCQWVWRNYIRIWRIVFTHGDYILRCSLLENIYKTCLHLTYCMQRYKCTLNKRVSVPIILGIKQKANNSPKCTSMRCILACYQTNKVTLYMLRSRNCCQHGK